jgi:hypothetical protein
VSTSSGWVALDKLKPSAAAGVMSLTAQPGAPGADVQLTDARSPQDAAKFLQQEARLAELERKSE